MRDAFVVIHCVPVPAQVEFPALEVTNVPLFIVFPALPVCGPLLLSYQSVAFHRVPTLAQVGFLALELTKVSLFVVFPPLSRSGSPPSKLPKCCNSSCFQPWSGGAPRVKLA